MTVTLPAAARDETRLIAVAVAASVTLHAVVLAFGPSFMHEDAVEPPRVLSVVLPTPGPAAQPSESLPREAPPPAKRPAARPAPRPAPEPPPRRAEPQPVAPAPVEPSSAAESREAPAAERSVLAVPAPPSPSAPVVAAAPREPVAPPDFRAGYLRNPPPGYPAAARRSGQEGTVTLRVLVSTEGAPREVVLERSSGSPVLDAAALETVKNWRFVPARRGNEPLEAWVLVPIVFRLTPNG